MAVVTIIGSGMMGSALAFPARENGNEVRLVGTHLDREIIDGVSSFGVDWFGETILPKIPESIPVLTVTKGLFDTEDGKLMTYPALWEERLAKIGKKLSLNAVGGPCTSYELVAHDQTEVAFCGKT